MAYDEPKTFEPLLLSIENVLNAIDSAADQQALTDAVVSLRTQFNEYTACCCRKAHVIPYVEEEE